MKHLRKYVRLILGVILLLLGIGFMVIPFIPIGYIFIFVAVFFLATYIPPLKGFLNYLKEKDKKGRLEKVEEKIEDFEEKFNGEEEDKTGDSGKSDPKKKSKKDVRNPRDSNIEKKNRNKPEGPKS